MASTLGVVGATASIIVCQGSPDMVAGAEGTVDEVSREGEAERVGVAVPIGAKLEGCDDDELFVALPLEMTTELLRRGWYERSPGRVLSRSR